MPNKPFGCVLAGAAAPPEDTEADDDDDVVEDILTALAAAETGLALLEGLGAPRSDCLEALVTCLCDILVARVPKLGPEARDALLT